MQVSQSKQFWERIAFFTGKFYFRNLSDLANHFFYETNTLF